MAESINLRKRLIGKEDINFDITGTNETETFFTADGGEKKLSKINASHFPLTKESREKLNATNVDEALALLSDKMEDFEAGDVLSEDVTINFQPEDDAETIQNIIGQQKKNLNGHTLTFNFPSSLAQNLYNSFVWQDFFNGTVVISGGSAGNRITIYDRQNITSLFRIYRCQCEVRIEYFYFVHQKSPYAISVESSPAVIIKDCQFSGMANVDSYAVNKTAGTAFFIDCEFVEDMEFYPPEPGIGKALGEIFAYPSSIPPEGAYLLNGQTIADCASLYPKFWEWVQSSGVRIIDNDTYNAELDATGVCGAFVVDSSAGSVRLPDVRNGFLEGSSGSTIGESRAAGLPNITGDILHIGSTETDHSGAFVGKSGNTYYHYVTSSNGTYQGLLFDASKSNSTYGKSNTVQPTAVRVSWCIQVYNAATSLSDQQSAELASLMQIKAQTDLANVDTNVDFVVKKWRSGTSWYRKYRSGWVEQGGQAYVSRTEATIVTLFVEMATADYTVALTNVLPNTSYRSMDTVNNRTETTITILHNTSAVFDYSWYVCGQGATE